MDNMNQTVSSQETTEVCSPKIKVICRLQDGIYNEQLLVDNKPATPSAACEAACTLLHAFAPESLARQLSGVCGKEAVVVFRTSFRQMEEFRALLALHDAGET